MNVTIYEHASELPPLTGSNYFHSRELMELCELTPRQKPYMVVASDDAGGVRAYLLAVERRRRSWLPPYLYKHVRVLGEGCYTADADQQLFGMMVNALTARMQHKALYIEFSNLSQKMFGYRQLRAAGFFPVKWMSIHNSLHSRTPEERISERQLKRINNAKQRGLTTVVATTDEPLHPRQPLLPRHDGSRTLRDSAHQDAREDHRHDRRGVFWRRRLPLVLCIKKKDVCRPAPQRRHLLGNHLQGPPQRPAPHPLHGRGTALPPQSLPRLHPQLRWQGGEHLPLVPYQHPVGQRPGIVAVAGIGLIQ